MQEKGCNNNKAMRGVSDYLDRACGWEGGYKDESKVRGTIHGVYHQSWGYAKQLSGNQEGANKEFKRAEEQFNRGKKQ